MLITIKIGQNNIPIVPPVDAAAYAVIVSPDNKRAAVLYRYKLASESSAGVSLLAARAALKYKWLPTSLDPYAQRRGGTEKLTYGYVELNVTPDGWRVQDGSIAEAMSRSASIAALPPNPKTIQRALVDLEKSVEALQKQ